VNSNEASWLSRMRILFASYPRQFWLMFFGMLLSTIGSSMIWPFLMIYITERLSLPLTTSASLMTVSSVMSLISSFIAGPVVDRLGRKWVMVFSLASNAAVYIFLSQASSLPAFALLMALSGTVNPLYRVGADAMMADLVPPEKRVDAYSLLRMSNNIGISLGPTIGGFIASASYNIAFYCAAAGMSLYSILLAVFAVETLPTRAETAAARPAERFGGYGEVLRDRPFISFTVIFTLVQMCATLIWVLLAVYTKHNYGISERQYGLLPTTNALMVVFLQVAVTQVAKRFKQLQVLAVGALFYAVAVFSISLGSNFWGFWLSMVIMTIGELLLVPTSSTYVANLAPVDKRGRYMSIYGLTWGAASGIGPVVGGVLSDNLGPKAPWIGGGLVGLLATAGFLLMARKNPTGSPQPAQKLTDL
jgi:MFS family permease